MSELRHWTTISPEEAKNLSVDELNFIVRPLVDPDKGLEDEFCPWPWEPQQLKGAPIGMFHCSYCGSMEIAGIQHSDARAWLRYDSEQNKWVAKDIPPE